MDSFEYSVTEGSPENLTEEQTQPFGIDLITISQSESMDSANYIMKQFDNSRVIFTNDINDTEDDKYYLVKNIQCPLTCNGYSYKRSMADSGTTKVAFIPCRIMSGFENSVVNIPGTVITVTLVYNTQMATIAYYTCKDIYGAEETKFIDNMGAFENVLSQLDTASGGNAKTRLNGKKLDPIKKYTISDVDSNFDDYITQIEEGIDLGTVLPIEYGVPFSRRDVSTTDYVVSYKKLMLDDNGKTSMRLLRIYPEIISL